MKPVAEVFQDVRPTIVLEERSSKQLGDCHAQLEQGLAETPRLRGSGSPGLRDPTPGLRASGTPGLRAIALGTFHP